MHLLILDRFDGSPEAKARWEAWQQAECRLEGGGPSHLGLIACRNDAGTAAAVQAMV